jgi:DNA-binding NtrC family response regulator
LSAAQTPLEAAVDSGLLRPDLRARLEGGVIALPPLRDCREVVVDMFLALFEQHAGRSPELRTAACEKLCLHDWPLNVRELDTVARRLALKDPERAIDREVIEQAIGSFSREASRAPSDAPKLDGGRRSRSTEVYSPKDLESLMAALGRHGGNLSKAAAELGIPRTKAYRMLAVAQKSRRPRAE